MNTAGTARCLEAKPKRTAKDPFKRQQMVGSKAVPTRVQDGRHFFFSFFFPFEELRLTPEEMSFCDVSGGLRHHAGLKSLETSDSSAAKH